MNDFLAIQMNDVWVQYRLRHAHHYNLKRAIGNVVRRRNESPEVIDALRGVTLDVAKGARVGLTGPNGAGKSTLLSVMAGILTPSRGSAITQGRVLALLGGPQQGLDPEQTGRENALFLGVQFGESPAAMQARLSDIKDFSGLGDRFEHPVHTYSSGMQVRLRFSAITSLSADILLVDEGIGQADEEFNERAGARLADFYRGAGTVVLASHNNDLLKRHCTTEIAVKAGECLPKGPIRTTEVDVEISSAERNPIGDQSLAEARP